MSARPASSDDQPVSRPARRDRHRVRLEPAPPTPPAPTEAPARDGAEVGPPRRLAPLVPGDGLYAPSPAGVRRPAQLSDRCATCGAPTRGRASMVTEEVEVGPVRALRVIACSACSDRRAAPDPATLGA
jgi:hypothetical protein